MRDLKKYAGQTNKRLIIGGVLLIFILGDLLIYLIYGKNAAILGFLCLGMGIIPVILIVGILWLMERIVKKNTPG
jgi:hypothetical protein